MKKRFRNKRKITVDAKTFYFLQCMAELFNTTPRRLVAMLVKDDLRRWRDAALRKNHEHCPR